MVRASFYLPDTLHQRLYLASKQMKKSVSQLAQELLDKALVIQEEAHTRRMYQELRKLHGIGPKGITDASTTLNEVLYGENGAWKGRHG
jgi:phage terminase large subunit-like protein